MRPSTRKTHESSREPLDDVIEEIRIAMLRKHWNQRDLAKALGVTEHWVSRRFIKRSDLSVVELFLIGAAVGVPAGELLRRAEESRARVTHKQPVRHAVALPSVRPVRGGPRRPVRLCPALPLAA